MQGRYYQHSGALPLLGLLLSLGAGFVVAAIGSVLYGYLAHWIPFIYLNVLLAFGFGALVGWAVGTGAIKGNVRNAWFVAGATLLCAVVGQYIAWVAWIHAISSGELLVFLPQHLTLVIAKLAETGVWTISGSRPTGVLLYCFWAGEALIVLGTALGVAWSMHAHKPFCEKCQRWLCAERTLAPTIPVTDPVAMRKRLEGSDYNAFGDLRPLQEDEDFSKHTSITLNHCDSCSKLFLLSLSAITITVNSKGESTRKEEVIVTNLLVEPQVHERVQQIYRAPEPGSAESEETESSEHE